MNRGSLGYSDTRILRSGRFNEAPIHESGKSDEGEIAYNVHYVLQ